MEKTGSLSLINEIKWVAIVKAVLLAIIPLTIVGLIGSFMQIPLIGDIIEPFIYFIAAAYVGYSIKEGYMNGAIHGALVVILLTIIVCIIMTIIMTFIDLTWGFPIFDTGYSGDSPMESSFFFQTIIFMAGIVLWVILFAINLISGVIGGVIGMLISKNNN